MAAWMLADAATHGWLSLMPPLVAICLAIATHRVLPSLLLGLVIGTAILAFDQSSQWIQWPGKWLRLTFVDHLWENLIDGDHLRVFAFTLMMGVMVALMQQSGAMRSLVDRMSVIVTGRCSCQLVTWMLGLVIFFDDYANTLLLGGSMQPLADRWKVSREKLAYLVDSTAAPVAGLAIVSTWVAGEIGYIEEGLQALPEGARSGPEISGLAMFVETIPYRFYVLWALIFIPVIAILRRDFGPMWRAEARVLASTAKSETAEQKVHEPITPAGRAPTYTAVVPVLAVVGVTLLFLVLTGRAKLSAPGQEAAAHSWLDVIGNADSYRSLLYGSLAGLLAALLLIAVHRSLSLRHIRRATWNGMRVIAPALGILWLAWSLSNVTDDKHLRTGAFLGQLMEQSVWPQWMPTVVFVLASVTAFSTGTSWGTMGILTPLVIPATHQVLSAAGVTGTTSSSIMIASVGSVLAGAIFGDHCSPISDTTVLSSQASGCSHIEHVRTQLPYALAVALVSIVLGTIPVGYGVSVWLLLPLGIVGLVALVLLAGRQS